MFKQKVNDYRITFRYSSYFHDLNHVNKKILELINDGVAKLAIDSSMRVYKLINNKLEIIPLNLNFQYNSMKGEINGLKEDQMKSFCKFDIHYIIEIAGQFLMRSKIAEEDDYQAIYLMLAPISIAEYEYLIYPTIKVYDNTITVEYRLFPNKDDINFNTFLKLIKKVHLEKNQIMMEDKIRDKLNLSSKKESYERLYDELNLHYYKLNDKLSLLDLIYNLTKEVNWWIGRQTYAVNGYGISEKQVKSLLLNYTGDLKLNPNIEIRNLREYEDYKYYSLTTGTMVVGKIEDCYVFADAVDDEILHIHVKYKYLEQSLMNQQSLESLYTIKKNLLNLKMDYLYKYNALYLSKKAIELLWNEFQFDELINTTNNLIELYVSDKTIQQNKKQDALNNILSIVAILVSSSPIYEYVVKPLLTKYLNVSFCSEITIIDSIFYTLTVVFLMFFILILKKIINH